MRFGVGDSESFDCIQRRDQSKFARYEKRTASLTFDDIHHLNTNRLSPRLENVSTRSTRSTTFR